MKIKYEICFLIPIHISTFSYFYSDSYFPNSVVMSSSPCWGTMRKSPSLLHMARLFMELLHVYTWTAIPCLVLLSPAPVIHQRRLYVSYVIVSIRSPATVWRPSIQSTLSFLGISKGFHLIWFGFGGWSLHFVVRNLNSKVQVIAASLVLTSQWPVGIGFEGLMLYWGQEPVQPGPLVTLPRGGEGGGAELLRIQPIPHLASAK